MKIVVLGAGLVGGPMAMDLAKEPDFDVTVADIREEALARFRGTPVGTVRVDLSREREVEALAREHDLVLSAVPGFLGYSALRAALMAGKHVVDIAFAPEDPLDLDALAKEKGVTALVDFGVAPGMSNVLAGHAHAQLDATASIVIYVGGLPRVRRLPYEYKAVFSPVDVIEEYTRPARFVENGEVVVRAALSNRELLEFPEVGTLEAFDTDGLRTMLYTMRGIPNMREKTMRYPGHIDKIALLRDTGMFGTEPVDVGGARVRPIDLTVQLLLPMWKLEPGEADLTVMRVSVEGKKAGTRTRLTYDLIDRYDDSTGVHSMARATGYTATAGVRMLARRLLVEPGVFAPEIVGARRPCVDFLLAELRARGVVYEERISQE